MRLAPILAAAAAAASPPLRGFLLVATNLPVQLLQKDADADWRRDELGSTTATLLRRRRRGNFLSHISRHANPF